ncbi:MAG: MFS transporter [Anaerolineales bacterium]
MPYDTERSESSTIAPADQARNVWAFTIDMILFQIAVTFISSTTVLPAFFTVLVDSEVAIGVATGLISGAWLLPQLFVASFVSHLTYKKPFMMRGVWLSRPLFLVMAAIVWLLGRRAPIFVFVFCVVCIFGFFALDATVSVPWFDLMARALPDRRRGRIQGTAQVLGGIGAMGVGWLVRYMLSDASRWDFPANYALLFAASSAIFMVSSVFLSLIREPEPQQSVQDRPSVRQVLASLPRILMEDRPFLNMIVVRILSGFVSVASAFYVLYATKELGFLAQDTGFFISAQVAGSVTSGLLMGLIQDRWGPLVHMRTTIVLSTVSPVLALLAPSVLVVWTDGELYLFLMIYFFLGLYMGNIGWPFFNWILEYVEGARRPLYIGMINTLAAMVMLAPTIGGWIVKTFSYPAVFGVALFFSLAAFLLAIPLPDTRASSRTEKDSSPGPRPVSS